MARKTLLETWAEADERVELVSRRDLAEELAAGEVLLLDTRLPVEIARRGTIAGSHPVPRQVLEWRAERRGSANRLGDPVTERGCRCPFPQVPSGADQARQQYVPSMEIERINPDGVAARPFYHHAVRSSSRYLVHVSGQVGLDSDGDAVGIDDFAAHVAQAYANLDATLRSAGATRGDVVKVTTYVVDYDHEQKWPILKELHSQFFEGAVPAWTVVGVESLARPDLRIEVEATAAID